MEEVAAAAELSKGTLYLYFKSKDELYLSIAHRSLAQLIERLEALPTEGRSGFQQLETVARTNRDFAREHPDRLRTMLAWMASGFHASPDAPGYAEYLGLVTRLFRHIVGVVECGKRDGSIRPEVDGLQTVMHLWGGTMGMWLLYFGREEVARRLPMSADFEQLVPSFSALLLRAIRNDRDQEAAE
jgi:AcrR family transcriptional regulator